MNGVNGSVKRKANFSSPAAPKVGRLEQNGSPMGAKTPGSAVNATVPGGTQYVMEILIENATA